MKKKLVLSAAAVVVCGLCAIPFLNAQDDVLDTVIAETPYDRIIREIGRPLEEINAELTERRAKADPEEYAKDPMLAMAEDKEALLAQREAYKLEAELALPALRRNVKESVGSTDETEIKWAGYLSEIIADVEADIEDSTD